jgi:hypothetical protein
MIFKSKARAIESAKVDQLRGWAPGQACRVAAGWTVISSWTPLRVGQFGILELA